MVIAEILAPSEDIQTQIFNKTTSQLKKKKKEVYRGEQACGIQFSPPASVYNLIKGEEKQEKARLIRQGLSIELPHSAVH